MVQMLNPVHIYIFMFRQQKHSVKKHQLKTALVCKCLNVIINAVNNSALDLNSYAWADMFGVLAHLQV